MQRAIPYYNNTMRIEWEVNKIGYVRLCENQWLGTVYYGCGQLSYLNSNMLDLNYSIERCGGCTFTSLYYASLHLLGYMLRDDEVEYIRITTI